jgi:hypothetical protein
MYFPVTGYYTKLSLSPLNHDKSSLSNVCFIYCWSYVKQLGKFEIIFIYIIMSIFDG